ncbi:MAG: hypothetical protein H0V66_15370 [Bdellovibrionales bacterium]|nr:hypothetical protein [Bdellovibrionales bacterium]
MSNTDMDDIIHFSEFLVKTVREQERQGNTKAKEMLVNYLEVINDGIQQYGNNDWFSEEADVKKLKQAQRILK